MNLTTKIFKQRYYYDNKIYIESYFIPKGVAEIKIRTLAVLSNYEIDLKSMDSRLVPQLETYGIVYQHTVSARVYLDQAGVLHFTTPTADAIHFTIVALLKD
jgi:hypothetical protein